TIDGDTLTTDEAGAWYEITLGDGYNLDADTKYAIVIRAPTGTITNMVEWRADISSPTYPGGCYNGSIIINLYFNIGSTVVKVLPAITVSTYFDLIAINW
ncbi:unnamed protein product, partial [marine sediment metagenome]